MPPRWTDTGHAALWSLALTICLSAAACGRDDFVTVQGPSVALVHVDVIDGTGGAVRRDQTVVITANRIGGTIQPGKRADLVVLQGDLVADIRNIRNVRIVFVDGAGFNPEALAASARGSIGDAGVWSWKLPAAVGAGLVLLLGVIAHDRRQRRLKLERWESRPT